MWALLTLRPYLEVTRFLVRTDHEALNWLMTFTDPSRRLTRCRLRLSEFYYEISYRPGRKHQVLDALSRLVRPGLQPSSVEDEIPTFGDQNNVIVTTRRGSRNANYSHINQNNMIHDTRVEKDHINPSNDTEDDDDPDVDEFAEFILDDDEDDELDEEFTLDDYIRSLNLPSRIPKHELLAEQRNDSFCQKVLARQSRKLDSFSSRTMMAC